MTNKYPFLFHFQVETLKVLTHFSKGMTILWATNGTIGAEIAGNEVQEDSLSTVHPFNV